MSEARLSEARSRILIVEDEPLLALLLEDALNQMGCEVICANALLPAMQLARNETIGCGFLDVKIGSETVVPVADVLCERSIPFVFSSNYGKELLPERYRDHIMLPKPYFPDDIAHVFRTKLNIQLRAGPMIRS